MNEEDLILEESDKVRLMELLVRMQDDGRTKEDLDLAVQMFTEKYAKKKKFGYGKYYIRFGRWCIGAKQF
jgi:hypothetical protein